MKKCEIIVDWLGDEPHSAEAVIAHGRALLAFGKSWRGRLAEIRHEFKLGEDEFRPQHIKNGLYLYHTKWLGDIYCYNCRIDGLELIRIIDDLTARPYVYHPYFSYSAQLPDFLIVQRGKNFGVVRSDFSSISIIAESSLSKEAAEALVKHEEDEWNRENCPAVPT